MRTFLGGGVGGWGSFLHAVRRANDEEDDECDDEKVNNRLDEYAPGDHGIPDLCRLFAEVNSAKQNANERHDGVIDERADNFSTCTAYDDADGKVEYSLNMMMSP